MLVSLPHSSGRTGVWASGHPGVWARGQTGIGRVTEKGFGVDSGAIAIQ
jgi:cobalamin biosynthesis protein CbiD